MVYETVMVKGGRSRASSEQSLADDIALLTEFAQAAGEGHSLLRANNNFRVETHFKALQLFSSREGLVATMSFSAQPPVLQVREVFLARKLMHPILVAEGWLPIAGCPVAGFCYYQWRQAPEGFVHHGGVAMDLWRVWLRRGGRGSMRTGLGGGLKLLQRGTWYPIQNIAASHGLVSIKLMGPELTVVPETLVVWLERQA